MVTTPEPVWDTLPRPAPLRRLGASGRPTLTVSNPEILAGLSAAQIASQLRNASNPVAQAIDGSAVAMVPGVRMMRVIVAAHQSPVRPALCAVLAPRCRNLAGLTALFFSWRASPLRQLHKCPVWPWGPDRRARRSGPQIRLED